MPGGTYRTLDATPFLANLGIDAASIGLRAARTVVLPDGETVLDKIRLAASGPETFSTSTALMPVSQLPVHDVNRYYRDLGVSPPFKPTKRELLRAYVACNGQDSERKTFCFKMLIDPVFRAKYDRRELGKPIDDKYRWKLVEQVAAEWAAEQTAETGRVHSAEQFIDKLGLKRPTDGEIEEKFKSFATTGWPYAYYLWRSRHFDDTTLSAWQSMLIQAMSDRGLSAQLAIGYVGGTEQIWVAKEHDNHTIIFFNERSVPDENIAADIAEHLAPLINPPRIDTIEESAAETSFPHFDFERRPSIIQEPTAMTETTEDLSAFFMTGAVAAEKDADESAAARKAARRQTEYLTSLMKKTGDSVIIRWLTDDHEMLRTNQHNFIPTKPAPADKPANVDWTDKQGAVCRYTKKPDGTTWFNDCYICDHVKVKSRFGNQMEKPFPTPRVWGLAAIREEVLGTQEMVNEGKIRVDQIDTVVSIKDSIVEYPEMDKDNKPTGVTLRRKRIVVVNMGLKNFFGPFTTHYQINGTLLDVDFKIIRRGEDTSTVYNSGPLGQIQRPVLDENNQPTGQFEVFDLRNPKYKALYDDDRMNLTELRKLVFHQASDDYYAKWFDPTKPWNWKREDGDSDSGGSALGSAPAGTATSEPAANTPQAASLAAMRDAIMEENTPPAAQPATATITASGVVEAGTGTLPSAAPVAPQTAAAEPPPAQPSPQQSAPEAPAAVAPPEAPQAQSPLPPAATEPAASPEPPALAQAPAATPPAAPLQPPAGSFADFTID